MTDKNNETSYLPAVGSRVQVTTNNSGDNDGEICSGTVIEDYADSIPDTVQVGHEWAPVHRWAIALDDGRLIFANNDDLTATN
ncbi:hypothetical protein LQL77_29375 [Rhodococcus cerastii]|nr:hypothetical protein [Rhodococcus cerastii]